MPNKNVKEDYEEKLADRFVSQSFTSYVYSRQRIETPPPRRLENQKIPEFKYTDAQTGNTLILELTTLTEDDEVMQDIRLAWSFADKLTIQLSEKLHGTFHLQLAVESVDDHLLNELAVSIQNVAESLKKGFTHSNQQPLPYSLSKEDDSGSELVPFLFRDRVPDLDEAKLKDRLLEEVKETDLKFEGYEGSTRILLIDISFCIGKNFARFFLWDVADQQLNNKIEHTYKRVDAVYLCKTIQAWRGDGKPIPLHGYQSGIERRRVVPEKKECLPQYQELGYWDFRPIYSKTSLYCPLLPTLDKA